MAAGVQQREHPEGPPSIDDPSRHPAMTSFLVHEHYIWNSGRPRSQHGTLELRSACQQPWAERHAANALSVALVCAAPELLAMLESRFGEGCWQAMHALHGQVMTSGLQNLGEADVDLFQVVLALCHDGLARRGRGEEALLQPLLTRLERKQNPAQAAVEAFDSKGIQGLLAHAQCG
ncbi:hypothetical protein CYMTET_32037 [Cymbomonas tetramitiformis]|uniref:Uncharacterized protein n=1 Tax=Cymbomonas tetramitiformis TaxID=36881 RepID=A0AAE0FFY3_9CHLO|nr:hypothetical protein CYMTET_32037 [Cymbomonas tetramitiformis]